jgi:hypothetical protein
VESKGRKKTTLEFLITHTFGVVTLNVKYHQIAVQNPGFSCVAERAGASGAMINHSRHVYQPPLRDIVTHSTSLSSLSPPSPSSLHHAEVLC